MSTRLLRRSSDGQKFPPRKNNTVESTGVIQNTEMSVNYIVVAVSAGIVCFVIVLFGIFCFTKRKSRKSSFSDHFIKMKTPTPLMATLQPQTALRGNAQSSARSRHLRTPSRGAMYTPRNINDVIDGSDYSDECFYGYESDQQYYNNIEIRVDPPSPALSRCSSVGSLFDSEACMPSPSSAYSASNRRVSSPILHAYSTTNIASLYDEAKDNMTEMTLQCSILHNNVDKTLSITLQNLKDIPDKLQKTYIFINVSLFPGRAEAISSRPVLCSTDCVRLGDVIKFEDITARIVEKCIVRMTIFCRKFSRSGKGKVSRVGELSFLCSHIGLLSMVPVQMKKIVQRKRVKRHCTSDRFLEHHLGELFLDLQLQSEANRLKVFIRRADHLPFTQGMHIVKPVHYLSIRLLRNRELLDNKETQTKSGGRPVWNQAFLFDVVADDINSYSLEIVIYSKGKLKTKDDVLGHVVIGNDHCPKSGRDQWHNMQRPRADVAKWHNILPLFRYL